jgi:SRSO17 transposase
MRAAQLRKLDRQLSAFLDDLFQGQVRSTGRQAVGRYVEGLLLDGERKSIEPIAERLATSKDEVEPLRQSLRYMVAASPWDEAVIFQGVAKKVAKELPAVEAFVIDDTGFAKKGSESVGVARQYSGTLGRVDNCQVAVSLHVAGEQGSACIGWRIYLPDEWANDKKRRQKVGVPDEVEFQTKWQISLALLDQAREVDLPAWPVLADAGYGSTTEFREGIRERDLEYAVGIKSHLVFWTPGKGPEPPPSERAKKRGRKQTRWTSPYPPLSAKEIALSLRYRTVKWREGSKGPQRSRFACVRVRSAHKHVQGRPPGEEEWLLVEWPEGEKEPTKYWLCTLPADTSLKALVRLCKLRWRVERDYEDMKGELGLDHFEGRMWRGFHHHAALCAVAHAFLVLQRALFPPEPSSEEVDDLEGEAGTAAPAAPAHRALPPLPPSGRPATRSGTFLNLTSSTSKRSLFSNCLTIVDTLR